MNAKNNRSVSLNVEQLEDRVVPTAAATLQGGILTINGIGHGNTIRVAEQNGTVQIQGAQYGYRASAVQEIVVNGQGDDLIDLWGVNSIHTVVHCGTGTNTVYGSQSNDEIYGGTGYNRLFGGHGWNTLVGGQGLNFMDGDEIQGGHARYSTVANATNYVADMIAPATGASAAQVKQGHLNLDCHFLACLAGLAQAGVNFNSYIHYAGHTANGEGVYNVTLFKQNGQRVTERVLFDGRTNDYDNQRTADCASWAIIMQRAYYQLYGNGGASPEFDMRALGRKPASTTSLTNADFAAINTNLARGFAVVVGTRANPASNLVGTHAYTVVRVGYINGVACVQLRNPWGFNGNARVQTDALIWVTWNQFLRDMAVLTVG